MPARRDLIINTGPLLALAAAQYFQIPRDLFARVIVPYEVVQEIEAGGHTQFACVEFRSASWLDKRATPTPLSAFLQAALDPGEAAVISLALSENIATVAIDETAGRRLGRLHGLAITGSLGILIQAKRSGLPVTLRPAIAHMRQHGIWLSATLEQEALQLAGE